MISTCKTSIHNTPIQRISIQKIAATFVLAAGLSIGIVTMAPAIASAQEQPEMTAAMEHLRQAKQALEHASKGHGGHRETAISLIDQAMGEVKAGKEYEKGHATDHDHDAH
jgi:hypothetical protein